MYAVIGAELFRWKARMDEVNIIGLHLSGVGPNLDLICMEVGNNLLI